MNKCVQEEDKSAFRYEIQAYDPHYHAAVVLFYIFLIKIGQSPAFVHSCAALNLKGAKLIESSSASLCGYLLIAKPVRRIIVVKVCLFIPRLWKCLCKLRAVGF